MGVGETTIGPGSTVESVLSDYDLDSDSLVDDLAESDLLRLQLAILLEARGESSINSATISATENDGRGSSSSGYISGTIQSSKSPTSDDDQPIKPSFDAGTIVVRSFSKPIYVAFTEPSSDSKKIQLDPNAGDEPFVVSPGGSWTASEIYVGVPDGGTETSVTVEAFE